MSFQEDNTTIVRMRKDFEAFIADGRKSHGGLAFRLEDDSSELENGSRKRSDSGVIPVKTLLGKAFQTVLVYQESFSFSEKNISNCPHHGHTQSTPFDT